MSQKLVMPTVILSMGIGASSAYAHHSHPIFYDACKRTTIEGRIERVEFRDPHTSIVLRLGDGTMYTVDWAPGLSSMNAHGVSPHFRSGIATTAAAITAGWR